MHKIEQKGRLANATVASKVAVGEHLIFDCCRQAGIKVAYHDRMSEVPELPIEEQARIWLEWKLKHGEAVCSLHDLPSTTSNQYRSPSPLELKFRLR